MSHARARALELAIAAVGAGMPVASEANLLEIAEVFLAWLEPPAPVAADGDDYPRLTGVDWSSPGVGRNLDMSGRPLPDRY